MEPTTNSQTTVHVMTPSDKMYKVILGVIVIAAIFLVGELAYQFASLPQNLPHEINVSGTGKAYIKPDVALISFGVTTQAPKSQDAVNQNNEKMNAMIKAIKDLGIADADIQTTLYNLSPVYNYSVTNYSGPGGSAVSPMMYPVPVQGGRTLTGYSLEQQVSVKIRNFDNINTILDKATSAGANTVGQLQFTVDNPEMAMSEARIKAIEAAQEKMRNLAKESGLSIGKLVNISEGYNNYPQPMYATAMGSAKDSVSVAPDIQAGQQEVNSSVTLTYQVK